MIYVRYCIFFSLPYFFFLEEQVTKEWSLSWANGGDTKIFIKKNDDWEKTEENEGIWRKSRDPEKL